MENVLPVVYKEGDKVKAVFQSACPRNNVRLEGTFLTVERQVDDSAGDSAGWEVVSAKSQLIPLFHIRWDKCGAGRTHNGEDECTPCSLYSHAPVLVATSTSLRSVHVSMMLRAVATPADVHR